MSSGLRLRRPVFFAGGLRCPVCLRRIALCPVFLSVFRLSSRLPFFSCRPAFPTARVSLCPCLPLPASRQLCRAVLLRLYSVWFFFCHFLFFRSSSIARRLLSVARCAVHRPALAACCPSLVAPFIVHRPPFVVRRPLSIPCRPLFIARCVARTPSPCRASFRCRSVRITAFVSAESRPACLRELLAVSFRSGSVGLPFLEKASAFRSLVAAPFLTK